MAKTVEIKDGVPVERELTPEELDAINAMAAERDAIDAEVVAAVM